MNITVLAFGIAKDILDTNTLTLQLESGANVGILKDYLFKHYPAFKSLKSLSIAVNEEYRRDDYSISEKDEIVIIPPVSGG